MGEGGSHGGVTHGHGVYSSYRGGWLARSGAEKLRCRPEPEVLLRLKAKFCQPSRIEQKHIDKAVVCAHSWLCFPLCPFFSVPVVVFKDIYKSTGPCVSELLALFVNVGPIERMVCAPFTRVALRVRSCARRAHLPIDFSSLDLPQPTALPADCVNLQKPR